ncbi:MAG: hypothetical protein ACYCT9_00450 [Leptospirillum sp.]
MKIETLNIKKIDSVKRLGELLYTRMPGFGTNGIITILNRDEKIDGCKEFNGEKFYSFIVPLYVYTCSGEIDFNEQSVKVDFQIQAMSSIVDAVAACNISNFDQKTEVFITTEPGIVAVSTASSADSAIHLIRERAKELA